jgi:preprotein translocase subunit SecG
MVGTTGNHTQSSSAAAHGRPSEAACAAATVAIALFLVGIVLAIATNSSSGSSALLGTIKSRLFSPVLVPAWLDLGFDHRITHGFPEDADHEVEIVGRGSDAAGAIVLPGPRHGERAARWRRLARSIAVGGVAGEGAAVAAGVGQAAFGAAGIEDVIVRVRRLPPPQRLAPADAGDVEQVFTARVRNIGGELQLIKDEPRGELAPLVPSAAARGETP